MILRRPYKILIKYFKIIHIIMFISFGYLVFVLRKIYMFFADYIKTSNFRYVENMVNSYVPWLVIVIVIILLGLATGIYLLMRKKEKPILFYKIMIIYCTVLMIILIYYITFFKSLDTTVYEPLSIALNRDISLIAYLVNFFFVAFAFIRGFGFDIKKFSFDRDKKDLNLDESDSEEYELNVNLEKEDIKSFINRQKRELRYYVKENKTFLIIVSSIIVLFIGVYFYYDKFVINKEYVQNDHVSINNLVYHVNKSIVSDIDKYGQIISDDTDYLIVDLSIVNNVRDGYLDPEAIRINVNNEYYYPALVCNSFSDMGNCYNNQALTTAKENNFILVFRIGKKYSDIYLEILKNKGEEYRYSKIKLSYTKEEIKKITPSNYEFEKNKKKYTITNYSLLDKTSYQYEECVSNVCHTYTKKITPKTGEKLLAIEFDSIDGLEYEFFNRAIGLKYANRVYTNKEIKLITINDNTVFYSIPIYLKSIDNVILNIFIRPIDYSFVLKGVENE